jgi:ankyrin repeat protein
MKNFMQLIFLVFFIAGNSAITQVFCMQQQEEVPYMQLANTSGGHEEKKQEEPEDSEEELESDEQEKKDQNNLQKLAMQHSYDSATGNYYNQLALAKAKELLRRNVNPDAPLSTLMKTDGLTPLMNAISYENYTFALVLLNYGADPRLENSYHLRALDYAIMKRDEFASIAPAYFCFLCGYTQCGSTNREYDIRRLDCLIKLIKEKTAKLDAQASPTKSNASSRVEKKESC